MLVERALTLKPGDKVECPADRGEAAYRGTVTHISQQLQQNWQGIQFVWIEVQHQWEQRKTVWPSNRLGV